MNSIRSRIRSGAYLALFALAVQIVISFGHVHWGHLGLPPFAALEQTLAATPAAADRIGADHHSAPDDYCALCAGIALLATGAPALPPVLFVPTPVSRVSYSRAFATSTWFPAEPSFEARAPPLA
jgi:uncharacterized membrane protein